MECSADAIIVGSGPSGVSVAFPLLAAGMRVMMLDGGQQRAADALQRGPYHRLRREDEGQWRTFLGRDLEALRSAGPPSPKFDAPGSRFAFDGFAESQQIEGRGFTVVGSLARGGLSNIWGAGVCVYDDDDLHGFPVAQSDLEASYVRVATRIGVCGFGNDDLATALDRRMPDLPPLKMSDNATVVLDRYSRRRAAVQSLGLRLGRPRTAVATVPRAGRGACTSCDMCVWGCSEGAIYSATDDLAALERHERFDYRPGWIVEQIRRGAGGHGLTARDTTDGGTRRSVAAGRVILAAGTLATTRLVLEMQGRFDENVRLVGTPALGFALCLPGRLGAALSTREFSMGQLSFVAAGRPGVSGDVGFGTLFPASGLPGALVIERMPLTRPAAVKLFRHLQPALLLGNGFLPGRYSRNSLRLERDAGGRPRLIVHGGTSDDFGPRLALMRTQLRRGFARLGAYLVPRSLTSLAPGEDLRYCGTLPLSAEPGPGHVDLQGGVHGSPGLHVVDLATFPTMPAKHHSLTLMANADRIGHAIASAWKAGDPRR